MGKYTKCATEICKCSAILRADTFAKNKMRIGCLPEACCYRKHTKPRYFARNMAANVSV